MEQEMEKERSGEWERDGLLTAAAFALVVVIAGGNPVAVRFSNAGLPPFWGAALRFGAAAPIFWLMVWATGAKLPTGRVLRGVLLFGLLSIGASYSFLYWGLVRAPAGLAGASLAFVPLLTIFFAAAHGLERLRWRAVLGAVVALSGILLGVVRGFGDAIHIPSLLALLAGAACIAEANVIFKLLPRPDPLATNALSLSTGVPVLLIMSLVLGEAWTLPADRSTLLSYTYLVLLGSVGMFYLILYILNRWTASATSYSFLLMPVSTVILAALIAGEQITFWFGLGAVLVVAGVWIGAFRDNQESAGAG